MNTTATKDLKVGDRYLSQDCIWEILEAEKLNTGNFRILAVVIEGDRLAVGNTWNWYGTPDHTVQIAE